MSISKHPPHLTVSIPCQSRNCILPPSLYHHPYGSNRHIAPQVLPQGLACRAIDPGKLPIEIYDARGELSLPGHFVTEISADPAQPDHQVFVNIHKISDFFRMAFGLPLVGPGPGGTFRATVQYGEDFQNMFWNGEQLIIGDGGGIFKSFAPHLDLMGHELAHGFLAQFNSQGESGAVKEHLCDLIGILAKFRDQNVCSLLANWTIAEGVMVDGSPLRSFASPGQAFNLQKMIEDEEPLGDGQICLYAHKEECFGEVSAQVDSGILNHAFYLFACRIGGSPWEKAGRVWFDAIGEIVKSNRVSLSIGEFAELTIQVAQNTFRSFPLNVDELAALQQAWAYVLQPTS